MQVSIMEWVSLAIAVAIFVLLVWAMLRPESF
jgi:K+-transporting ATPase KdpF subunit